MPVGSQSRRASIYLATGNIVTTKTDDNNDGGNRKSTTTSMISPSTPIRTPTMIMNNIGGGGPSSMKNPFFTSEPSSSSSLTLNGLNDDNKCLKTMESSLMTSLSTNYRPSPTIEQLLNSRPSSMMMNDNQLPILLYIRNYNEYRRHRPVNN